MNSHSTQLELSKCNRGLLYLPSQLTISYGYPPNALLHFGHISLHRKWQSCYSCVPRCVHCIFQFTPCKIPVLDLWQPSPYCILAERAKCPSCSFLQYIEKDFGFLINTFLLFQGSIFGLGALLWHPVSRVEPWDKYWMSMYKANKVNVSRDDNWKKPTTNSNILHFTGEHTEISSRSYSAKNKGWGASKTPQITTFVAVLGPERAEQLLWQHLQSNKYTCALWVRSFQMKMLTPHLRII